MISNTNVEADQLEWLLNRIEQKDQVAFRELHDRVVKRLNAVANRLLQDSDLSKDVVQETFIQIWNKAGEYQRDQGEPMTWMNAILRYRAIDKIKQEQLVQKRRNRLENLIEVEEDTASDSPISLLLREELHHRLSLCLGALRTVNRNAILMAYGYEYSRESIALHFNQPVNSVKTWLRRDLCKLNRALSY